ncbi:MAG: hypothetical protein AAGC46_08050 [Solirubrobacteraceae bacterium]|nr:hypothetical protein [Patulibacter sp.]
MRLSLRTAPAILGLAAAAIGAPATAGAAVSPPITSCTVAPPTAGSIRFFATPTVVNQGTQRRLAYSIKNVGRGCVGVSAAPYALQISGFAGWSNVPWNLGILPQYVRVLQPGQSAVGVTAPLPATLNAGAYYRLVPRFTPDSAQPVTSVPLTVIR